MAKVVEHRKFICVCFDETNNNKYWQYTIYDDGTALTEWGRVGGRGDSQNTTSVKALAKMREKTNPNNAPDKRYTEVKALDSSTSSKSSSSVKVSSSQLKEVAKKQIKFNCSVVEKLVEFLTDVNAHNIMEATKGSIQYNIDSGQFQTPMGIIMPEQVSEARTLLFDLARMVEKKKHDTPIFREKLNEYLRRIPHAVGMKKIDPYDILPNMVKVQSETDILDGLEASFNNVVNNKKKDSSDPETVVQDEPKIFDVQLQLVQDGKIVDKVKKLYTGSINRIHASSHYNVKDVYEVVIGSMSKDFDKKGKSVGNVMDLWHGTKCSNLLSILKHGLIIPSAGASYCTGRLFGDGLYFSDQSTKALNYAGGNAPGQNRSGNMSRTFMFLADVAMGKMYTPRGTYDSFPKSGYDSTFAKADISGVRNNEMIVYKTCQANLKYLIEFK